MIKTTEMIDDEIDTVKCMFGSVEEIIGELADENGRKYLVHRELRTFSWFVGYMIFAKWEELDGYELEFKKEYDSFRTSNEGDSAEDLFDWACLYWIYNEKWKQTDEYKKLEESVY